MWRDTDVSDLNETCVRNVVFFATQSRVRVIVSMLHFIHLESLPTPSFLKKYWVCAYFYRFLCTANQIADLCNKLYE